MYTYIISILFFFLLSGVIFKKKIQQNIFSIIVIITAGSFISTAIVNGIFSSKIKYERTLVRKEVYMPPRKIFYFNDTTEISNCRLGNDKFSSKSTSIYTKDRTLKEGEYSLHIIEIPDTTRPHAYFNKYKDIPVNDSRWISTIGIPRKNVYWDIYLPNDSISREMVETINKRIQKSHENKLN